MREGVHVEVRSRHRALAAAGLTSRRADAAGVTTTTLRRDDAIGLLTPARRVGGKRRYTDAAIHRVRIINRCRAAGFSLEGISGLLDGDDWQQRARDKRAELEQRSAQLADAAELIDQALACGCDDLEGCDRVGHDRHGAEPPVSASWVTDPTRPIA